MKKKIIYILLIILLILVDQILKNQVILHGDMELIKNTIDITYAENTGGAFSLGQGNISIFIVTNILVLTIIITLNRYLKQEFQYSIVLILAGGISNLLDRIFRGFVVDYIDISKIISFPIFNFADILICIGVFITILTTILMTWKERDKK